MASYFVRNSVFRLLNGPTASSVSVSVQAGATAAIDASTATSNTTTHTASTSTAEPEVHTTPAPAAPAAEAVVTPPAPAPVHVQIPEVIAVEVPHVAVQEIAHVDTPLPVAVPEPSVPSAPKSYSDMARAGAIAQAVASPSRLTMRPSSARPATALKTQESFSAGSGSSKPPAAAAGPSLSLYVKQVPENASEQDVLTLFGRFGPVKRVELNGQRGFAFVDYESASAVQACLSSTKESALELLGSALKVEERNSRGGGGPGGNSSGGRSKSGVRREGDNRDRREGGRGEGGRGAGREGGDRERRDRDRRGPKSDGTNGNGAASGGSKPSAEGSVRAAKK
jgi:RNA recognition motif. (a.k.a. RRM, RBD, or RNP domain)